VIGTAGQGVVNTPYQVTDRALAAKEFGFSGTLERGIEECATNSDNILAFRCGTKPMVLAGVGLDTTTVGSTAPGFDITFSDVTADAGTRYSIWYKTGVLSVWKDGKLVYSNVVTRLGMEACCGGHFLGAALTAQGHDVRLYAGTVRKAISEVQQERLP